jgi:hypothetical protein
MRCSAPCAIAYVTKAAVLSPNRPAVNLAYHLTVVSHQRL